MIWFVLSVAMVIAALVTGNISGNVFLLSGGLFSVAAAIALGFSWLKDCFKGMK